MKERELKFKTNDDETLVKDEDGKLVKLVEKLYKDIHLNIGFCLECLKKGKLTEGMKETHLSLTESYVVKFLSEMGYEGVLRKEREERYIEIRSLNMENRELRKQLGQKVSNEDCRERLNYLEKQRENIKTKIEQLTEDLHKTENAVYTDDFETTVRVKNEINALKMKITVLNEVLSGVNVSI